MYAFRVFGFLMPAAKNSRKRLKAFSPAARMIGGNSSAGSAPAPVDRFGKVATWLPALRVSDWLFGLG
jgi:hypothetical protein